MGIKHKIFVLSGKGGVGKSSVAAAETMADEMNVPFLEQQAAFPADKSFGGIVTTVTVWCSQLDAS